MKVLLINGSPHEQGCTHRALLEIESTLDNHKVEFEEVWIGNKSVPGCIACGKCSQTKKCIFDDAVNQLAERINEFDAIVVGSPVYYAGASGQVTAFLDRFFYICGGKMAGKAAAAVVSCRRGGASAAFDDLNKYFLMNNMYVVGSTYWNQVHGSTPEDVEKDEEGLQTMRRLAENMSYLLFALSAAKQAGISGPNVEKTIRTNFIR